MQRGWSGGIYVLVSVGACVLAVGLAACGGGSGRLSKAAYRSGLAKISRQADSAHGAVDRGRQGQDGLGRAGRATPVRGSGGPARRRGLEAEGAVGCRG